MANLNGWGNGLRNMKQRIEAIGGEFNITTSKNNGTEIAMSVPFEKLNLLKNTTIV